jgi:PAS domain S-box-containing protein
MSEADAKTARILVVDDIADNRNLLNRRLAKLGFESAEADNGVAAIRLIEQRTFDLVLLDIMMPGIDGIEVLKRIRLTHSQDKLPVIMLTGKACNSNTVVEAFELGANDFLTKPVDFAVAVARVRSHLARKQAQEAMERSIDTLREVNQKLQGEVADWQRLHEQSQSAAALLDSVIEYVPAALVVQDVQDHRYAVVNGAAETMWGLARSGIIGKTAYDLFDNDEAHRIEARDVEALGSAQQSVVDEGMMQTPRNGRRLISTSKTVIRDANREPRFLLKVMNDMTEPQRAAGQDLTPTSGELDALRSA